MAYKFRRISVLFAMLMIAAVLTTMIPPTNTISAQGGVPDATVAIGLLRVRSGPFRNASIVDTVPKGTTFTLDGRNSATTWLHGTSSTGVTGWLSRFYVAIRNTLDVTKLPILGASAASSTSTTPTTGPVSVSGRIGRGFELGGQVQGLDGGTVAAMQRAGMHWAKFQLGVGDGTGAIGAAHAAGFKVLLSVKGDKNSVLNPGYFDQYAGYVGTLAQQGADAIEVWNEANLDREWPNGQISPATYTQLLAKAFNAIKSQNANTIVISGAPSPTGGAPGGRSAAFWNDDVFYQGMAAAGAGKYADCIGIHYNEGTVSPADHSGGWLTYPTNYFDSMLSRALGSFPGKQGCFTELGYVTSQGFSFLAPNFGWATNTTVAEQAAWLAQAAVRASRSGRVRLMIIWNVNMTYYGMDDPQAGYAIIRPGGSCPACDTLHSVAQ